MHNMQYTARTSHSTHRSTTHTYTYTEHYTHTTHRQHKTGMCEMDGRRCAKDALCCLPYGLRQTLTATQMDQWMDGMHYILDMPHTHTCTHATPHPPQASLHEEQHDTNDTYDTQHNMPHTYTTPHDLHRLVDPSIPSVSQSDGYIQTSPCNQPATREGGRLSLPPRAHWTRTHAHADMTSTHLVYAVMGER